MRSASLCAKAFPRNNRFNFCGAAQRGSLPRLRGRELQVAQLFFTCPKATMPVEVFHRRQKSGPLAERARWFPGSTISSVRSRRRHRARRSATVAAAARAICRSSAAPIFTRRSCAPNTIAWARLLVALEATSPVEPSDATKHGAGPGSGRHPLVGLETKDYLS
jgi:hypothetical protein